MLSARTRLDRFVGRHLGLKRQDIRPLLAQGRIVVDGCVARDVQQVIHQFTHVIVDQQVLQNNKPRYVMMNKPRGVVSATNDPTHKTLINLLESENLDNLHIAGRLDFNSTGLVLLTNDGRWSRQLSIPANKIYKRYRVELQNPLNEDYIHAFSKGMYFDYEGIITQPAKLIIISDHIAEVTLVEGRYHQIKRMFGRFQNKVLQLHRLSIGNLALDPELSPGQSRSLSTWEVNTISQAERVNPTVSC